MCFFLHADVCAKLSAAEIDKKVGWFIFADADK
jgi:hypothetical protein